MISRLSKGSHASKARLPPIGGLKAIPDQLTSTTLAPVGNCPNQRSNWSCRWSNTKTGRGCAYQAARLPKVQFCTAIPFALVASANSDAFWPASFHPYRSAVGLDLMAAALTPPAKTKPKPRKQMSSCAMTRMRMAMRCCKAHALASPIPANGARQNQAGVVQWGSRGSFPKILLSRCRQHPV